MDRVGARRVGWAVAAALAVVFAGGAAHAADDWLYVKIESSDPEDGLELSVPVSLVRAALSLAGDRLWEPAEVHGVDLRSILRAVLALEEGEELTLRERDETARIRKERGFLIAEVDERHGALAPERVRVRVPLPAFEALTAGGEHLDLGAALDALAGYRGRLVDVDDGRERVRIWIAPAEASD